MSVYKIIDVEGIGERVTPIKMKKRWKMGLI